MMLHRLRRVAVALCLALTPTASLPAAAHDVPGEIDVQALVEQDGRRVEMLVRIPLVLLTSLDLPKRGAGYIDLERVEPHLDRAAGAVAGAMRLHADGEPVDLRTVGVQLTQPSNRAFAGFDSAKRHLAGPLPGADTNIFWNQGYFDVHYTARLAAADASLSVEPWVSPSLASRTSLSLRYLNAGSLSSYLVHGQSARLHLDPAWWRAASTFTVMGVEHIFGGIDHVLFILAMVLPFRSRDFWSLAKIVTGFTIAHSITLSLAATGAVEFGDWLPPLVETVIAASILFMCLENILAATLSWRGISARWLTASLFGLVHGFGFSFALADKLQLSGGHLATSLAAFNIGVELGQLAILAVALAALALLARNRRLRRVAVVTASAFVAHTAWHWTLERFEALRFVRWPDASINGVIAAPMALLLLVGLWFVWSRRPTSPGTPEVEADETRRG